MTPPSNLAMILKVQHKPRFLIFERKEAWVLIFLGLMVAFFAFTLGIHLGKEISPKGPPTPSITSAVPAVDDLVPNAPELEEQAKIAEQTAEETIDQAAHDEVARTGLKMDTPRQVTLPNERKKSEAVKTESDLDAVRQKLSHPPSIPAESRPALIGKYTLQVGSHPKYEEAKSQAMMLEGMGLKPVLRAAEIKSKGRWYRVYLDSFDSKVNAEKVGQKYRALKAIESYIVVTVTE